MDVQWDYMGLVYRHTEAETDDPDCHIPQKVSAAEFIIHAANLHLFRLEPDERGDRYMLWSSMDKAPMEDRVVPTAQRSR